MSGFIPLSYMSNATAFTTCLYGGNLSDFDRVN